MKYPFIIGELYSRKDVYRIVNVPEERQNGAWNTGYNLFDNCAFIFSNIGVPGRTGHDYKNLLADNVFHWYSKNTDHLNVPRLKKMISGEVEVYIFTRESADPHFTFRGLGYVLDYEDGKPAYVAWGFVDNLSNIPENLKYEKRKKFLEGAKKEITSNRYERNPEARKACLEHYGFSCLVCNLNFEERYGEIGKGFIHVHHVVEISTIGEKYEIDPIIDLKPVCPNCHAMLHKRKPAYSIEELREIVRF